MGQVEKPENGHVKEPCPVWESLHAVWAGVTINSLLGTLGKS